MYSINYCETSKNQTEFSPLHLINDIHQAFHWFSQWPYPVSELLSQKWLEESEDHVEYVRLIYYVNILYSQCNGILQRNTEKNNI